MCLFEKHSLIKIFQNTLLQFMKRYLTIYFDFHKMT